MKAELSDAFVSAGFEFQQRERMLNKKIHVWKFAILGL